MLLALPVWEASLGGFPALNGGGAIPDQGHRADSASHSLCWARVWPGLADSQRGRRTKGGRSPWLLERAGRRTRAASRKRAPTANTAPPRSGTSGASKVKGAIVQHVHGLDIPQPRGGLRPSAPRVAGVRHAGRHPAPDRGRRADRRPGPQVLAAAREAGVRVLFMRHLSMPRELMGVVQFRMAMAWQRVERPSRSSRGSCATRRAFQSSRSSSRGRVRPSSTRSPCRPSRAPRWTLRCATARSTPSRWSA